MTEVKMATEEFLGQQMALLQAGDTEGLSRRYATDATFVRFDRIARGQEQVKALFDEYLTQRPEITDIHALQLTDDVIFYKAAEEVDGELTTAVGTLVFKDGLVWRQTVAFVPHRPG
jgi:hypothetical protein